MIRKAVSIIKKNVFIKKALPDEIDASREKKSVLVIGGGGREHAIINKLKDSKQIRGIFVAPGNAGILKDAIMLNIPTTNATNRIVNMAKWLQPYMTVVSPDAPLAAGLVDELENNGLRAFGPHKCAAEIESSKIFAKNFMHKYKIPTAEYNVFTDENDALDFLDSTSFPTVIKADGLALGKGVVIAEDLHHARQAVKNMMSGERFGDAGKSLVVEKFMKGFEVSILAFCDGKTVVPMVSAHDYKRAFDGDLGPNTGGMGAFSPSVKWTKEMQDRAMRTIFVPTVQGLASEGRPFKGVIYFGLMVDGNDINVVEYNARFGDPECQVVLPRLENDLLDVFDACIDGTLDKMQIKWKNNAVVCVVAASRGYPDREMRLRLPVHIGDMPRGVNVLHAGTAFGDKSEPVTSGGRVLNVIAEARTLAEARDLAYEGIKNVDFDGMVYRTDILKDL
ncbi:MAG: phosphoribosylamine--glycine ligase [Christensenellaceae bacterium]|jgi:phosphoribosylamine--glycine ligase|nr:phosphoribosylamine--glycine ligase [Christensenellaceae bacterium]